MTCSEARQYIFAFLDNELDSALSLEMQQHIEHCPLCARECEIENVVRTLLAQELQRADDVPEFDESALVRLIGPEPADPPPARRITLRNPRLATVGAIAAALLFAVTLFMAVWNPTQAVVGCLRDRAGERFACPAESPTRRPCSENRRSYECR